MDAARPEDLDYGDIDGIEAATRKYPLIGTKNDEVDTALGHFLNNAPQRRCQWFRQCGLFAGASAITALRCHEASSTWDTICRAPHPASRVPGVTAWRANIGGMRVVMFQGWWRPA